MVKVILATNNQNKVREFRSLFNSDEIELLSLKDIGFTGEIDETGSTFAENAFIKASTIAKMYNTIAISDDSGLEVEALGWAPGIYSARFAGVEHSDESNNALLVQKLKNVNNKKARYVCAICICKPDMDFRIAEGKCYGEIILEPKGENGFGYDPYFYFPELKKTFAEISLDEKNKYSHRAKALRRVCEVCDENLNFK